MPFTPTVTFTGTHADNNAPTQHANGFFTINSPDNSETIGATTTKSIDLHYNLTVPVGYIGIFTPHDDDILGAIDTVINSQMVIGTGSPAAFKVRGINITGASRTPNDNVELGQMVIIKGNDNYKYVETGVWA